jgi:hypothetical protein
VHRKPNAASQQTVFFVVIQTSSTIQQERIILKAVYGLTIGKQKKVEGKNTLVTEI